MKKHIRLTSAFTMIELIFAIVIVGILAATVLTRVERDLKMEAADNLLSAFRYTQHLALIDDKHDFNDAKWQRRYWRLYFGTCNDDNNTFFYTIGSDDDMTGSTNARVEQNESAIDPASGKPFWWKDGVNCDSGGDGSASPTIFISHLYGIDNITASDGGALHIAFDRLGRPHRGSGFSNSTTPDYSGYLSNDLTFTFHLKNGESFQITILQETGYAYIVGSGLQDL